MDASLLTVVTMMIFESGALANLLSDKPQGALLAARIEQQAEAAIASGQIRFDVQLTPFEVGMAWSALTSGSSPLAESLGVKVRDALAAKLQELGIEYGGNGAGGGGDGSVGDGGGGVEPLGEQGSESAGDEGAEVGGADDSEPSQDG